MIPISRLILYIELLVLILSTTYCIVLHTYYTLYTCVAIALAANSVLLCAYASARASPAVGGSVALSTHAHSAPTSSNDNSRDAPGVVRSLGSATP